MRSLIHDDIQRLHSTMPLWGVDHWVPLGNLFVDVNILEQVSSSRRLELDDLWQDFTTGNSDYHSLDRIGLGKKQQRVSGLTVLERNTNLMVVGKPGSGKTTYLQRIVTECNDGKLQAYRIPVLIKLREFVNHAGKYAYNLEQFLGQLWRLNNADIELLLNQGRVLVLLDGLDEVAGEAGKKIAKEIKRFARDYPQLLIVVSCRTQTLPDLFDWISNRFTCVEVADFNENQVSGFVANWFEMMCANVDEGETQVQEFLSEFFKEENKQIQELATTPILLSLTCLVFKQTGKFYSKRSKLYQEGLELLLEQWDEKRGIERDEIYRNLPLKRKLEVLRFLAVKKFDQEQYVLFEQEELEGYIGQFLGIDRHDSQRVLLAIESQHGLLIERSHKVWSFSHLTFQEYLVAQHIISNYTCPIASQYLVERIHNTHWQEIFLIAIEIINKVDTLIKYLKQRIDNSLAIIEKLQCYLDWLVIKSQSVNVPYKPTAIRYFYFILSNKISPLGKNQFYLLNPSSMFSFHYDMGIDKEMIQSLASNFDPDVVFDRGLGSYLDPTIELNLDRSLMRLLYKLLEEEEKLIGNSLKSLSTNVTSRKSEELSNSLDFTILFEYDPKKEYENLEEMNSFSIAARELELALQRTKIVDNNLYIVIIENKDRLFPAFDNFESMKKWWVENGTRCIEEFRAILIEYRDIGHDWKFNKAETDSLWEYSDLNKILIDCLQSSCLISEQLRQEIVNTLWLPICKIKSGNI